MSTYWPGVDFLSMNMTVSTLDAYISQIPAARARQMTIIAEATMVPHLKEASARRLWNSWTSAIYRASQAAADAVGEMFTVNGTPVRVAGLKKWVATKLEGAELK